MQRAYAVAAVLWALIVATAVLITGSLAIAEPDESREIGIRILEDGQLTAGEIADIGRRLASASTSADECDIAESQYEVIADSRFGLSLNTPDRIDVVDTRIPDDLDPKDANYDDIIDKANDGRKCTVYEERRSAEAGISVMLTSALGGIAALLSVYAWQRSLSGPDRRTGWIGGTIMTFVIIALTVVVAGTYRFEPTPAHRAHVCPRRAHPQHPTTAGSRTRKHNRCYGKQPRQAAHHTA